MRKLNHSSRYLRPRFRVVIQTAILYWHAPQRLLIGIHNTMDKSRYYLCAARKVSNVQKSARLLLPKYTPASIL